MTLEKSKKDIASFIRNNDVVVECSLISKTGPWFVLLSLTESDLTGGHYALKACPYVQVRLEAITGGGSVDAYIIYRGN